MAKPPKPKATKPESTRSNSGIRHRKNKQSDLNLILMGKGRFVNFHKRVDQ